MWWLEDCSILVYQYGSNICHSQMQGCNRQVLPTTKPLFFCRVQSQTPCYHSAVFEGIKDRLLWTCQDLPGSRHNSHRMPDSLVLPTPGLDFFCILAQFIYFFLLFPVAYRITVPQPGIEPTTPAVEHKVLTTRPPRNLLSQGS